MKQIKQFIKLSLFIFILTSCNKSKDATCQTCTSSTPDLKSKITLTNKVGDHLDIDMAFWKTTNNGKPDYFYGTYTKNHPKDEYSKINNFMSTIVGESIKNEFLSNDNYSFTLYLDGDISKKQNFTIEDILGFNIYHVKDHFLYHKFFIKEKFSFVENKRLSVKVKGIDIFELYKLAENYFLPKNNSITALNVGITDISLKNNFIYSNNVPENLKLRMAFDLLSKKSLSRNLVNENDLFEEFYKVAPSEDSKCPKPCLELEGFKYCESSFPDPSSSCKKKSGVAGDCPLFSAAKYLVSEDSNPEMLDSLRSAYNLRDNFLLRSNRGTFYSDTYYYISSQMSALNPSEIYTLAGIYIKDGTSTINKFMYGNQTTSLYGDSVMIHSLNAISIIRSKISTTDTLSLKIMDWYSDQIYKYKDSSILSIKNNF